MARSCLSGIRPVVSVNQLSSKLLCLMARQCFRRSTGEERLLNLAVREWSRFIFRPKSVRLNWQERRFGRSETSTWRGELADRLEAYRVRRRRISPLRQSSRDAIVRDADTCAVRRTVRTLPTANYRTSVCNASTAVSASKDPAIRNVQTQAVVQSLLRFRTPILARRGRGTT